MGPLVVAPMLGDGYDAAFLTAGDEGLSEEDPQKVDPVYGIAAE